MSAAAEHRTAISLRVNGAQESLEVPDGEVLVDTVRDRLRLKGTKISCAAEVCGACTVLVGGLPVSACNYLTVETDGVEVTTVEGVVATAEFARIERAFIEHAAVQCGFCTPGIVMTLLYLRRRPGQPPDREELAELLSGNLCRCTGYRSILDAAIAVLDGVHGEVS